MTIGQCIEKYYGHFHEFVKRPDVVIADSRTNEDVLHDMMVMALNKFGDSDVEEEVLYEYLKKSIAMQLKMQPKKRDGVIEYVDNLNACERNTDYVL